MGMDPSIFDFYLFIYYYYYFTMIDAMADKHYYISLVRWEHDAGTFSVLVAVGYRMLVALWWRI